MRSKGFSLIELLIAMAISLIAILMLLMLFKQVTRVGMASSQDAELDAKIDTAMLVIQKMVQNAGYGTGNSDDITVVENDSSAGLNSNIVFWRINSDVLSLLDPQEPEIDEDENIIPSIFNVQCYALSEAITSVENSLYSHQLVLSKTTNCTNVSVFTDSLLDWQEDSVISSFTSQTSSPIFSYKLEELINESCSPHGIKSIKGSIKFTVIAEKPTPDSNSRDVIERISCLTNITL